MTEVATTSDGFNYAALDPAIATPLRQQAERIRARLRKSTADIIETGRDLLAVKAKLDHGTFVAWVEKDLKLLARTAQLYMSAARLAAKNEIVSLFQPTTVYRLAAESMPDDIRAAILTRAEAGDVPSDKQVKDAIARAAKRRRKAERQAEEEQRRVKREQQEESAAAQAERERQRRETEENERRNEARAIARTIAGALDAPAAAKVHAYLTACCDWDGAMLLLEAIAEALEPTAMFADTGLSIPAALRRAH